MISLPPFDITIFLFHYKLRDALDSYEEITTEIFMNEFVYLSKPIIESLKNDPEFVRDYNSLFISLSPHPYKMILDKTSFLKLSHEQKKTILDTIKKITELEIIDSLKKNIDKSAPMKRPEYAFHSTLHSLIKSQYLGSEYWIFKLNIINWILLYYQFNDKLYNSISVPIKVFPKIEDTQIIKDLLNIIRDIDEDSEIFYEFVLLCNRTIDNFLDPTHSYNRTLTIIKDSFGLKDLIINTIKSNDEFNRAAIFLVNLLNTKLTYKKKNKVANIIFFIKELEIVDKFVFYLFIVQEFIKRFKPEYLRD